MMSIKFVNASALKIAHRRANAPYPTPAFPHIPGPLPGTLYNAFAGDYNRRRGERAAPAFSPIFLSPLWPEGAAISPPSYLSQEGLEILKSKLAFTEGRILTPDNGIKNAVMTGEGQGGRETVEAVTAIPVQDQAGRSFRYTTAGAIKPPRPRASYQTSHPSAEACWGSGPLASTCLQAESNSKSWQLNNHQIASGD